MKKFNLVLLVLISLSHAFMSCEEDSDISSITTLQDVIVALEGVPDVVITSDSASSQIIIPFNLSDEQIVNVRVGVSIDEANTTATLGDDFDIESFVDVEGYANTGMTVVNIYGDIRPDGEPEVIVLKLGPAETTVSNPYTVSNEATVTIQIEDYNSDDFGIVVDWDGLLAVPSVSGTDEPVYGICDNGVDLDPLMLLASDLSLVGYSDDWEACPEIFSQGNAGFGFPALVDYPNDTFIFATEVFDNVFANFSDAEGDFCIEITAAKVGQSYVNFFQESDYCPPLSDAGNNNDPNSGLYPISVMIKNGSTFYFYKFSDDSFIGEVTARFANNMHNLSGLQLKRSLNGNSEPFSVEDLVKN